jgi:hypothetical protein
MSESGDFARLLFEIPIYRKSHDAFYAEQQALMGPRIERKLALGFSEIDAWHAASWAVKPYAWDFNDVVGWVTIHGYHDMVKMYLWWTKSKSIRRAGRHVFEPLGKLTETLVFDDMTNAEIGEAVRADLLTAFAMEPAARRSRHIDLRTYDALSPFLDWWSAFSACEARFFDREED